MTEIIVGLIVLWVGYVIYKKMKKSRENEILQNQEQEKQQKIDTLIALYQAKKFDDIVEQYHDYETERVDLLQIIGLSYFNTGKPEKGERVFMKCLALTSFSDKDDVRLNLGKCWFNAKNYRNAIKYLQEISYDDLKYEFAAGKYDAPYYTGLSYFHLGKYEAAIEVLKKAPVNKKDVNKSLNKIIELIGECYEAMGNKKMAIKFYNKALSNDITLEELEEKIKELEAA